MNATIWLRVLEQGEVIGDYTQTSGISNSLYFPLFSYGSRKDSFIAQGYNLDSFSMHLMYSNNAKAPLQSKDKSTPISIPITQSHHIQSGWHLSLPYPCLAPTYSGYFPVWSRPGPRWAREARGGRRSQRFAPQGHRFLNEGHHVHLCPYRGWRGLGCCRGGSQNVTIERVWRRGNSRSSATWRSGGVRGAPSCLFRPSFVSSLPKGRRLWAIHWQLRASLMSALRVLSWEATREGTHAYLYRMVGRVESSGSRY